MTTPRHGHQSSLGAPPQDASTSRARKLPIGLPAMLSISHSVSSALTLSPNIEPLRKKALLTGINYPEGSKWHLKGPQKEVREFRELLFAQYGYRAENIVVLTDEPGTPAEYLPTRANILREIMRLTVGSSPGDEHIFMFSGHSAQREESKKKVVVGQSDHGDPTDFGAQPAITNATTSEGPVVFPGLGLPSSLTLAEGATVQRNVSTRTARTTTTAAETTTLAGEHAIEVALPEEAAIEAALRRFMAYPSPPSPDEEDGCDEYIIPLDAINPANNDVVQDKIVLDDVLRQCLILPLRPQAKLVAIFDCCHSATLLDLKHHRCHRIGTWASRLRRFCRRFVVEPYVWFVLPIKSMVRPDVAPGAGVVVGEVTDVNHSQSDPKKRLRGRFSGPEPSENAGQASFTPPPRQSSFNIVLNPRKPCSGLCARMDPSSLDRQHVLCVSACKDRQMNIENEAGESMTKAIIALLRENPYPTLRELMQAVNHNAKRQHGRMKKEYRVYEKAVKARGKPIPQEVLNEIALGKVMCENVQRPQMSSSKSLNLRKTFLFAPSDENPVQKGRRGFSVLRAVFRRGRS